MKGMLIPTNGNPVEIDIEVDETGSTLHDLQRLVGGNIEPFDVIFGEGISLYVNEEGLFTCPPNRAVTSPRSANPAAASRRSSQSAWDSAARKPARRMAASPSRGRLRHRVPPPRNWPRDATPAHRHEKTPPSCRYIESHHGRKVGKHHGIRQEHPRRAATAAPRPR